MPAAVSTTTTRSLCLHHHHFSALLRFQVFLEDVYVSHPTVSQSRKLSCGQSLRDLKSAVMDVSVSP